MAHTMNAAEAARFGATTKATTRHRATKSDPVPTRTSERARFLRKNWSTINALLQVLEAAGTSVSVKSGVRSRLSSEFGIDVDTTLVNRRQRRNAKVNEARDVATLNDRAARDAAFGLD